MPIGPHALDNLSLAEKHVMLGTMAVDQSIDEELRAEAAERLRQLPPSTDGKRMLAEALKRMRGG